MIEAILLGTAQDGGVPHAGCNCPTCAAAWANPARQQHPACLGLGDYDARRFWLIDATPAFPAQLHAMQALVAGTGRVIPTTVRRRPGGSVLGTLEFDCRQPGNLSPLRDANPRPPPSDLRLPISDLRPPTPKIYRRRSTNDWKWMSASGS